MDVQVNLLVRQAQEGNREAFTALYDRYGRELYRYALFVLGTQADAQDAVQEAVLCAWQQLPALRDSAKYKAWLFRILANICRQQLSRLSSKNRPDSLEALAQEAGVEPFIPADAPDVTLSLTLQQALFTLPPQEKQIVLLSVLGGYKSHEIAWMLRCSSGTVRSRLKRALGKLRKLLEEQEAQMEKELQSV